MRVKQLALCVFILAMIVGVAGAQTPPTCPVTRTVIVHATIVVSGATFNGSCTRYSERSSDFLRLYSFLQHNRNSW
jgi:hypothetical protein